MSFVSFKRPRASAARAFTLAVTVALTLGLGLASSASADVLVATASGQWNTIVWNNTSIPQITGSTVPGPLDDAIIPGFTVTLGSSVEVQSVEVLPGGILRFGGLAVVLETQDLDVHGRIEGGLNGERISVTPPSGGIFDVTVHPGGQILGGQNGDGGIFIHDPAGGDLPCPTGSSILIDNGAVIGGGPSGSVYMVADQIVIDASIVEGGSGPNPPGNVYIAGTFVDIQSSAVTSGNGGTIAGSVKILGWSCVGTGFGAISVVNSTVQTGTPSLGTCPGVLLNAAIIANSGSTIGGPGVGCTYWDPPLLQLNGDATFAGDRVTVVAEDLDARGLVSRTLATPALDAVDELEIKLAPGGVLDLRGLPPGTPVFSAGSRISLCADEDLILTDDGTSLDELANLPPELCDAQTVFEVDVPNDATGRARRGTVYEHPIAVTNVGSSAGTVKIAVSDSAGWLVGGPFSVGVTLDPAEPWRRALAFEIPARGCSTEVEIVTSFADGRAPRVSRLEVYAERCEP